MGPSSSAGGAALRRLACRSAGVMLVSDIHERACDLGLSLPCGPGRRGRIERIVQAGLVFVHVPKAAGMSVSQALYGNHTRHMSIRLLKRVEGGCLARLPSFAVLRHPVDRFLSAYRYARAGGGAGDRVADPFRDRYRRFRSLDDALDHVEQAGNAYRIDHIFRPQHWYLTDRSGRVAVDRLLRIDDLHRLPRLVPGFPETGIPHLNRSPACAARPSSGHVRRIERLYAPDLALWSRIADESGRPAGTAGNKPLPFSVPASI